MSRFFNKHLAGLAIACTIASTTAMALPLRHYATNSKLASGKWVKIAVPSTGVYEITDAELQQMGFSNPEKVQVFGMGGNAISETLDGNYPDDLQPVSIARFNDKLCFYGLGPTAFEMADARTDSPFYKRTVNPYSTHGYYLLTEVNSLQTVYEQPRNSRGTRERITSLDCFLYEKDLVSPGFSGKSFLGDNIGNESCLVDFNLPGLADNSFMVKVAAGVYVENYSCYLSSSILSGGTSTIVNFPINTSKIYPPVTSEHIYYKAVEPVAKVTIPELNEQGQVKVSINNQLGTLKSARLDYVIISYNKENKILDNHDGQTNMGIADLTTSDVIILPEATSTTVVWDVNSADDPVQYELTPSTNEEGDTTGYHFTPRISSKSSQYVAFDPAMTLKRIDSFEEVENQNLHALPTPDMLIISNKAFLEQAERVAQLHRDVDGMDVIVVDHEKIFNEFSSGTPDAMAYRLLCKMFYDRDKTKFKNLLLFGQGSYDNRGIISNKANRVITYQSAASSDESDSYVSDDFFGFLNDDSGSSASHFSDVVKIGVGRYPVATIEEAKNDVDKLIKYVAVPDYGPWRNDMMFISDTGDNDRHIFQTEGISELAEKTLATQMQNNKVYVDMFELSVTDKKTSSEARRRMQEYLNNGQYFATYVGHAGPLSITRSNLWNAPLAQSTYYPHLPIFTTACCEVARYDSDTRGIAEYMFHCPDGGAIAMLATPRAVFDSENYNMNKGFVNSLFSYRKNGRMPTLGEVYMGTKAFFGTTSNGNKLSYSLLGDPAIKCNYPKPLFNITRVNGEIANGDTVFVSPMQSITITAQVDKADGSGIDTDFNGDATLTLYDTKRLLRSVKDFDGYTEITRDIYYPRDILARVQGRVVNGLFTGTVIIPRHTKALNENAAIKIYAHQDDSDNMVNGEFNSLHVGIYNEKTAVTDDNAPVIESMYINDQQAFADGCVVPQNSILYISASDDVAINTMSASVGNTMKLLLDGGKTVYSLVKNSAVASNEGRNLDITFPLNTLAEGNHTLSFTVFDAAGHSATRTISFVVTSSNDITLNVQEAPASKVATFDIADHKLATTPNVNIKVTDAQGNIVWNKKTSSFPAIWDLTDAQGNRVKPGLYKFFGNYDNGTNYGGTNIGDLIIIDPVKK